MANLTTHLMVLPQDVLNTLTMHISEIDNGLGRRTDGLRLVKLLHFRTDIPSLFLLHPDETSISEIQSISPNASRSWFMDDASVISDGKLLLTSPVDPAFLLNDGSLGNFRTMDDIFEDASVKIAARKSETENIDQESVVSASDIRAFSNLKCIQKAMRKICEYKNISDDIAVFRFSQDKFISFLMKKVARLSKQEIQDSSRTLVRTLAKDGLLDEGKELLLEAARTQAACELVSHYISPLIYAALLEKYDFTTLRNYVQSLENQASENTKANINTTKTTKDSSDGKKRKNSMQASRGVENLKKVNTSGMAKISTFFKKPIEKLKAVDA